MPLCVSQDIYLYQSEKMNFYLPMFPLPKKRPALVDEGGGGGFWICDAVGARDWRIEYVRCMLVAAYDMLFS